jgi:outer membrane receptor protein involved in Fe transport
VSETAKLLVVILCSLGLSSEAMGQRSAPDLSEASLEQLGSIEVYGASKHLQAAGDAPSSVTVITADEIQQHGYRTLADALETVRGFFVSYDRNYSSIGVRGFCRPGDFNTRILLLVDGHRLNDNIYDEAMLGTEFPVDIDLIRQIEVIRGPVSSLYGSNALFAVINIITRRSSDVNGLEVSSEAASFNAYKGRISYGGKLKELDFMLSGTFYGAQGNKQLFYPEYRSINSGIADHLDDDQVASTLATFSFRDFTVQSAFGSREKGIPTAPYGTLFGVPGTRTVDAHSYIDFRYARRVGDSTDILVRGFYDRYTYRGTYIYASADAAAGVDPNLDYGDGKWWGSELQLSRTLLKRNRITVGGEYRDNIRQDQTNYNANPTAQLLRDRRTSFIGAAYVQDEFTIAKPLTLNAGLRYEYYSIVQSNTDPRLALIYRPAEKTAFKLIYGEAFRVPNVYEMYYSIAPNRPNPLLKPETIRSTEVVWEQGLGGHFWVSTSAFYNTMDHLITLEPMGDNEVIFRNLQKTKSTGLELELQGQAASGLEGSASYSFQQTRDRSTGSFLSDSPRNMLKLSMTKPFFRRKLFASFNAQYRSRLETLGGSSVPPYAVVNVTLLARRLGEHFDLAASAYNLLDKKYFDPSAGDALQPAIQQDGRSVRLKLTWNIGER